MNKHLSKIINTACTQIMFEYTFYTKWSILPKEVQVHKLVSRIAFCLFQHGFEPF